jgi:hypothetical protein
MPAHVSPVTWAEVARYAVPVRECPGLAVDDDHDRLVAFTRRNLEDYWAPLVDEIAVAVDTGADVAPDEMAEAAVGTVLGIPRLAHAGGGGGGLHRRRRAGLSPCPAGRDLSRHVTRPVSAGRRVPGW